MNLLTANLGTYTIARIDAKGNDRKSLKKMGIVKGVTVLKRGICPKHTPIKVVVGDNKFIMILIKRLAEMVIVA